MDRNFKHKEIVNRTQTDILQLLYLEEKPLDELKKQLKKTIQPSTLFKYLDTMEKDGLLKRILQTDRRKRNYKITSKGKALLNELDTETKGKIFSVNVFTDIESYFEHYFIFDARLPDNIFDELFNKHIAVEECLERHDKENLIAGDNELKKQYQQALASLKISPIPPSKYNLRPEFFYMISKTISDAIIYISIKGIETEKEEMWNFLSTLPVLLVYQIAKTGLSTEEFKKCLLNVNIFDDYYTKSQTITPENYKKVMNAFSGKNRKTLSEEEKEMLNIILQKP